MFKVLLKFVFYSTWFINTVFNRLFVMPMKKSMLKRCGKKVIIGSNSSGHWQNISIGNNVSLGKNTQFICSRAEVIINDNVMFGPNVTIITGGHRYDLIGKTMISVSDSEKKIEDDKDIIFEGDNWVGANSTILKGVTIGYGSIIAAGSVITRNVPNYSIFGGVPGKLIKRRFSEQEIIEHEKKLKEINGKW